MMDLATSRSIVTGEIEETIKHQADTRESIRVSRERGEIWIYNSDYNSKDEPSLHAYRLQNQPQDFDGYLNAMQYRVDGTDAVIKQLRADLDSLDRPSESTTEKNRLDIEA